MIKGESMKDNPLMIYVISDSIGETGELIAKAAAKQFEASDYEILRFPYHNSIEAIEPVFEDMITREKKVLIYTNVEENTRKYIENRTKELNIPTVDVMGPPMKALEQALGYAPLREPGLIRRLDENYFKKVEAIEFAVKYDDGKDPRGIMDSDLLILGISRTSKTPLSMYLAHKLIKVCNVPLVPEVPVPAEVYKKDPKQIVGLIAGSDKIFSIREERLKSLGLHSSTKYADLKRIQEEIDYSTRVMKEIGCPIIDVTHKAIEETAELILEYINHPKI